MTNARASRRNLLWKVALPLVGIWIVVAVALFLVKQNVADLQGHGSHALKIGDQIEDFPLSVFGGKQIRYSKLRAKVVMINFWASWCEACMVELPSIVKLHQNYKKRGFDVVAVNLDENPASVVPRIIKRMNFSFPVYLDEEQNLSGLFRVHGIPLTVILDKNRKVLFIESGDRDWYSPEVRKQLEKWLG